VIGRARPCSSLRSASIGQSLQLTYSSWSSGCGGRSACTDFLEGLLRAEAALSTLRRVKASTRSTSP
jgi:hypothetical protein